MTKAIVKKLYCVTTRDGMEIWISEEKKEKLELILNDLKTSKLIGIEDIYSGEVETPNSVDISGIYSAAAMEDKIKRKNFQWKCKYNNWHGRGEKCDCKIKIPSYAKGPLWKKQKC